MNFGVRRLDAALFVPSPPWERVRVRVLATKDKKNVFLFSCR